MHNSKCIEKKWVNDYPLIYNKTNVYGYSSITTSKDSVETIYPRKDA